MENLKKITLLCLVFLQIQTAKANWFGDFFDWISGGRNYGLYREGGSTNRNPPLSTFDRGLDVYLIQREKIRTNIISEKESYKSIYNEIYTNAKNGSTSTNCERTVCGIAKLAKDAAFIYLMGFDENGANLDGVGDSGRQYFYDKARDILKKDEDNYGSFLFKEDQQYRPKELMNLLQAHDYLNTAKLAGITSYPDYDDVREELADFTYDLYGSANNIWGSLDAYNNLTLIVASSIGMAACVLSDKGTYFWRVQKKPERWANAAHAYINRTLWTGPSYFSSTLRGSPGPMAKDNGDCANCISGYAEGPGYFYYGFESLLPFFTTYQNFVNRDMTGTYYTSITNFSGEDVRNYVYNPAFEQNLYKWYNNIKMPNGDCPTYDDTWGNFNMNGVLALTRKPQYNNITNKDRIQLQGYTGLQLRQDYLAAFTYPTKPFYSDITDYDLSGDLIIRNNTGNLPTEHYLHLNAEGKGISQNGYRPFNSGHEHGDISNFIITAGEDVLAIDPAFYGWEERDNIHNGNHHNVITIDSDGPDPEDKPTSSMIYKSGDVYKIELKYKYMNYVLGWPTSPKALFKRNIEVHDEDDIRYYKIYDEIQNKNWYQNQNIKFNLNGNGNEDDESCFLLPGKDNSIVWKHPCDKDNNKSDNWKMQATISTFIEGKTTSNTINIQNGSTHGNFGSNGSRYNNSITSNNYISGSNAEICNPEGDFGHHSRMTKNLSVEANEWCHFQTTIQVLGCNDSAQPPQIVMSPKYTSHLLSLKNAKIDILNYHFSRINNSNDLDTVINPFNVDSNSSLKTDAQNVFFSYSIDTIFKSGYCDTYTFFRKARIENGKKLIYKDSIFIKSNKRCEAFYKLVGKYQYQGYIQCDSIDSVSFYLPDLDSNYAMGANGKGITYVYNDTTHIITLIAPVGRTEFLIQLADPCVMNCYFPTATDSIKNTFDFGIGIPQSLPYKLTITPPNGLLKIRNASKMQICPQKWLRNNDSLIMEGPCPRIPTRPSYSICPDVSAGGVGPNIEMMDYNDKSEITVSDYAALILDSGSYTRFGNNTRLIVMPYGSLIIRKNAIVDIGDEKGCGYAEIICHPNSYVQFEDSANIKFWKKENDTNDIHVFYISVLPSLTATHAGIEPSMSTMLTNVDAIPFGTAAPICNVAQIRAGYGINNRDWGFTNFALPKAWASISQDTFCPGQCPTIDFDRMLNDTKRSIKFCRIDTNYSVSPPEAIFNTCIYPDIKGGNGGAIGGGDLCDTLQYIGPLTICNTQIDDPGKWYRITLISYNDCGQMDSINLYYYNQHVLNPSFSLAQTGCPNNIQAYENSDSISRKYREKTIWHVHLIDTTNTNLFAPQIQYGGDWEYDNLAFPDTFTFPNFRWLGGYKYAVSHTVSTHYCGDTTTWDSIVVIPGAYIKLSRPTVFGQPISGNTAVQLNGYLSNADSFNWNPTTWLDSTTSLTPISTPNDSITYILTAYKDGCTARDTAHIKYNRYANAGYSDTLCFDSTHSTETLIGFPYDMSLFLGMLYYYDNYQFMRYYNMYNTGNLANYFRYFTHFMHDQSFENATTPCPVNLFNVFASTMYKELFFKKSWFKTYYQNLTLFTDPNLPALEDFDNYITSDTPLKDHLDSLDNWGNIDPCIDNLFTQYNDYVNLHANEITTSWSRITDGDTTTLTSWDNYFVAVDAPVKSSKYLLSVITPAVAEIDEITILVDTLLTPLFAPAMQFDSTVYLMNYTEPVSTATHYEWNFGDGSTHSFETHPIHTFPVFDSNYVVCLIASNFCSTFTYCDTVRIDSLHLGGVLFAKKQPAFYETNISTTLNDRLAASNKPDARSQQLVALTNYPNPFNNSTIIDYEIWQNYTNAELRITNVLGQTLFIQKLNKPIDKIQIDGGALSNGIYYYSIIIDGTVSQTRSMSVIH